MTAKSDNRTDLRIMFDHPTRLRLLENDADKFDENFSILEEELAGIRKVLTGILITVTTGVVGGALLILITKAF